MAEIQRHGGDLVNVLTGEVMPEEGWRSDESGLPVAEFYTSESVEGEWSRLKSEDNANRLQKGALALRVSARGMYGHASLEKFGRAVGESYGTIAGYMRIYERVAKLRISPRGEILGALDAGTISTSHLKVAAAALREEYPEVWGRYEAIWQEVAEEMARGR